MLDFERETATLGRKEAKELSAHSLETLTEAFKEMGLTVEMGRSTYYAEGHRIDFKFSVEIPAKADVMKNSELQSQIQYTLQLLMIVMVALEVAIPPNPYAEKILIIGFLVIALKYNFVTKISDILDKLFNYVNKKSTL